MQSDNVVDLREALSHRAEPAPRQIDPDDWRRYERYVTEIFASLEQFYRRFYFRPRKIFAIGAEMLRDRAVLRRRLGEGADFLRFLARRRRERH